MRRLLAITLFAALALVPAASAAPVFFVEGRGWGHGIGMPQYGAQGFATRDGRSYAWILAHYFRGTSLGRAPVTTVRVLLADNRSSLTVGSEAAFSVTDANGQTFTLPAGSVRLGPALEVDVGGERRRLVSPARFERGGRPLELAGKPYRGQLVVRSDGRTLSAVNHVGLEEYLYGVVPDEMPPTWHMEALKAQAVAARSYAVVSRRTGGVFDVFPDTRSQVYGGLAAEEARTNAAVDATAGEVVVHNGRVAWTFFHSTSGGRTAAIHDVWNAAPVPYLVSVADPHDDLSPYHRWGPVRYTARQLVGRLGSLAPAGRLVDVTVSRNASRRAETVSARGSRGPTSFSASSFQSRLALRSTWFSVSVLSVTGPRRLQFGRGVELRGIARGPRTVWLERKPVGRDWERVRRIVRGTDGTFRARVAPVRTTAYRLSAPVGRSDGHRVVVAPVVRFSAFRNNRTLVGSVRPAVAGARVTLERLRNGRWTAVAATRTDARGRFRLAVALTAGRYRGVATVGRGYAPGRTPAFAVVPG